jgi:hypothetical protein
LWSWDKCNSSLEIMVVLDRTACNNSYMTKTPRTKYITFHNDKNGRRYATEFFRGRNFRIALAEAEALIALGVAIEEAEIKW